MKNLLILMMLVFSLSSLSGQADRPYRQYRTQKVEARLLKEDSGLLEEKRKIERHVANFKLVGKFNEVTIPIIFHVLHNTTGERISEDQVLSQLSTLNLDFSVRDIAALDKHPADIIEGFDERKPDELGIQFCLADYNQENKLKINYISTDVREWEDNDAIKYKKLGGSDAIQPEKYLNVWIGNLSDKMSGYAQMPGGLNETDGIVIDYEFFGTIGTAKAPYQLGKTFTHLVGSYLGLYELWNETYHCGDDYVQDTPIHNAPNLGPTTNYKHVSNCHDHPVEMSMNYMDNSDDAYLYMFTIGQMVRMHSMLVAGGPRHNLLTSNTICSEKLAFHSNASRNTNPTTFVDNESKEIQLSIFPNPAKDQMQIQLEGNAKRASILIYNSVGNIVYRNERMSLEGRQNILLDVRRWSSGLYFIHMAAGNNRKSLRFSVGR